jgi:hypothetical protein
MADDLKNRWGTGIEQESLCSSALFLMLLLLFAFD